MNQIQIYLVVLLLCCILYQIKTTNIGCSTSEDCPRNLKCTHITLIGNVQYRRCLSKLLSDKIKKHIEEKNGYSGSSTPSHQVFENKAEEISELGALLGDVYELRYATKSLSEEYLEKEGL
mmetsp:Transcript_7059/g.10383  ORF Transcript_7059/g.10383 Transcript_7059/m.10383 type:complete len:121 (-) Transcript_7059:147-509(-)